MTFHPDRSTGLPAPRPRARRPGLKRPRSLRPGLQALEKRELLAAPGDIAPGFLYQEVAFYDASGDTVSVKLNGPTSGVRGFRLELAGGAVNASDIQSLTLEGLTADNGLDITVTPNELTIEGGADAPKLYSAGYTNISRISATGGMAAMGSLHLGATIVNNIALPAVAVQNITLDTGMVAYVDAVNAAAGDSINIAAPTIIVSGPISAELELFDESPTGTGALYMAALGLIDLYDVEAKSIGSIVVNGAIGADSGDPFDETKTTNDLRGVIEVAERIGSVEAPRSAMRDAIRAGSIGRVRLGRIDGEITSRDASQPMTLFVPMQFSGAVRSAGHLNLGFSGSTAEKVTADFWAGGGISGSDPSTTDPLLVPDKFTSPVTNTSPTAGIADIEIAGVAASVWRSAASIGDITAQVFGVGSAFLAGGAMGDVTMLLATQAPETQGQARVPVSLEGAFQAGGDIGRVWSASGIKASLIAGGSIGAITGASGGLESTVVLAGGDIGQITVFQTAASTAEIKAGGDIAGFHLYSGDASWNVKARNIGAIVLEAGAMTNAVFVASGDIGDISVTSPLLAAIEGGSLIAGGSIGTIEAESFGTTGIHGVLIQAGDRIAGVTGISYGNVVLPEVTAGVPSSPAATHNGIDKAQILATEIGPIMGIAHVGTGLLKIVAHARAGGIDSITGVGNGDGINAAIVVAEQGIGPITGRSTVQGDGIYGGSFDANGRASAASGTIGQVTAEGGPAGGDGIELTRFQASNRIAGIDATANSNGGDALRTISTYAESFGAIKALVLGGQTGNGIVDSNLRAWSDHENNRPEVQVGSINVEVRSALGMGISNSIFQTKGDLTNLQARAFNAAAISGSQFSLSQGDFGRIHAETINGSTAIENSLFDASNGSITSAKTLDEVATSGITAIASGTSILSNAISGSSFSADANIGVIKATTRGGTAILNSTFLADSNYGSSNNGPNLPDVEPDPTDEGAIYGIHAETSGQWLISSAAISGSTFEAEKIGFITARVVDREEGGAGISASTFNARNAVFDGLGNFDNKGTIGAIDVVNGSLRGNGIEESFFYAGGAGSIGDINVAVLGGAGITASEFRASFIDYDQKSFTGTIGKITVSAGRSTSSFIGLPAPPNDAWTLLPAGIDSSYFAALAGIGDLTVNSLGTGVFFSAFLADFDLLTRLASLPDFILPFLAEDVPGDMGDITITSRGRFGSGAVLTAFTGASVGDINIQVASRSVQQANPNIQAASPTAQEGYLARPELTGPIGRALQGVSNLVGFQLGDLFAPAASAGSIYLATAGNLGSISTQNAGPGFDSLLSAYVALPVGFYGPVAPMDNAALNFYWAIPRLFGSGPATFLAATGAPAAGTYRAGSALDFTVDFSGPVDVTGTPTLPILVGTRAGLAEYVSGSGTSRLTFRATVQAGDSGAVTVPTGASIVFDVRNRITESGTGRLVSGTVLPPSLASGAVADGVTPADSAPPVVVSVSPISPAPGRAGARYRVGQQLSVVVTFSEAIRLEGLPTIALMFGRQQRFFSYAGGDGTNTLVFTYVVTRNDVRTGQVATTNGLLLLPPGDAITDAAGNPMGAQAVSASTSPSKAKAATPKSPTSRSAGMAIPRRLLPLWQARQ